MYLRLFLLDSIIIVIRKFYIITAVFSAININIIELILRNFRWFCPLRFLYLIGLVIKQVVGVGYIFVNDENFSILSWFALFSTWNQQVIVFVEVSFNYIGHIRGISISKGIGDRLVLRPVWAQKIIVKWISPRCFLHGIQSLLRSKSAAGDRAALIIIIILKIASDNLLVSYLYYLNKRIETF